VDVVGDGFAKRIAEYLGENYIPLERRVFPDGEVCPRVGGGFGSDVVLAIQMDGNPNTYMMEVKLTSRTLKDNGAERILCVIPYLIYSRQDKVFRKGEPISLKYNLDELYASGIDEIITLNSHTRRNWAEEGYKLHDLNAVPKMVDSLPNFDAVVGPDKGTIPYLKQINKLKGVDYHFLEKSRDHATGEIEMKGELDVEGKKVLIFDDMVSSGGTIKECLKRVKSSNTKKVYIATVHGLFLEDSLEVLKAGCDGVFATNTVPNEAKKIDVTSLIGQKIRELQKD
jgi:ribose-phosphate pyrophosphokinase